IPRSKTLPIARSGHLNDLMVRLDPHDLAEVRSGDLGDFRFFLWEELGIPPEDRNVRAHRCQEESVLRGDIPASNHRDARRKFPDSEDRVAREVSGLRQA